MQTRFATDERVYKAFLEILNMYRKGQKTIGNVYEEVCPLSCSQQCSGLSVALAVVTAGRVGWLRRTALHKENV